MKSDAMRRYLIYIITATMLLPLMWGCSVSDMDFVTNDGDQPSEDKPTTPIKRRPIVPSTKLPRPRIISNISWVSAKDLGITLTEYATSAEVIVRDTIGCEVYGYVFEGDSITISVPAQSVEVEVCIDDERYIFRIEEE